MSLMEVAEYGKKNFDSLSYFETKEDARLHEFNSALIKDHGYKEVIMNLDEIHRLDMVMAAPYSDCVC